MFEQPMRTDQVFGISTEIRPVSYVDRGELDSDIQTYLGRDTHIAIRGESKCGKSWFRQKNIANPIVVQCRLGRTVNDLFVDALSQLDIRLEVQSLKSSAVIGRVSAQGDIGAKILAKLGIGVQLEGQSKSDTQTRQVGHDVTDLRFIADIIRASERRLVIEDFHYLNVEERRRFAFDLKALWDYRVYAIVIGVWSQSNLLLHLNPDLTGRVHEITIYWSDDDLTRVLDKGGTALDIHFTQDFKDNALNLCYSNVGILQKLTLETLDQAQIRAKQKPPIQFYNNEALYSAALFYAEQLNPLYQQFARAVAEGIRTRKDSTGIYAHAMAVIMAATDSKLIRGLNVDEIHDIAHAKQPRIQKGNLKAILEKIESLQVDKDGRGLILDYNETNGDVTVVDRQLLLYRRFCTVRWPWEDLIQEAERQAGEQATGAYGEPAGGSAEAQS